MAHTNTITEHGCKGTVDTSPWRDPKICSNQFRKQIKALFTSKNSCGLTDIIQTHPGVCKPLFVKYAGNNDAIDADYLFSSLHLEHAEEGSSRRKVDE